MFSLKATNDAQTRRCAACILVSLQKLCLTSFRLRSLPTLLRLYLNRTRFIVNLIMKTLRWPRPEHYAFYHQLLCTPRTFETRVLQSVTAHRTHRTHSEGGLKDYLHCYPLNSIHGTLRFQVVMQASPIPGRPYGLWPGMRDCAWTHMFCKTRLTVVVRTMTQITSPNA